MSGLLKQFTGINNFLVFFSRKLRLSKPWNFKAPLLISFPYLILLLSNNEPKGVFIAIVFSITIIIGVAGIGYLSNDWGDRKKDALIGKENVLVGMPFASVLVLLLAFLSLTLLPWLYLPFNRLSAGLLGAEIILFMVYALPPLRLKEKGFFGLCADALYAHVLPAVLASYTFYLFAAASFNHLFIYLAAIVAWQFIQGLRNILFHQIQDSGADVQSGTHTFVTAVGLEKAITLVKKAVLPLESLVFILFLAWLCCACNQPLALIAFSLYLVYARIKCSQQIQNMNYRARAYLFLDDFYILWFPLAVLVNLLIYSTAFLPVLLLHLFIFNNGIRRFVQNKMPFLRIRN